MSDEINLTLSPWISDLVVDTKYQKQGIGKMLLDVAVEKSKKLGFKKLYLFTFDPTVPKYYQRFGWKVREIDKFHSRPVTVMEVDL